MSPSQPSPAALPRSAWQGVAHFVEMLLAFFRALRPHQWVKNTFLFAGLIFSKNVFHLPMVIETLYAFGIFCGLASGLYLVNDLLDLEKDRTHPSKKNRPIASGKLPVRVAIVGSVALEITALTLAFSLDRIFGILCLAYFVLNLAYSMALKHLVIIDVFVLAIDFVIRAVAGAAVIHVKVSPWLVMCTMFLALFLGFGKRRQELILLKEKAGHHRKSLEEYSAYFLDQMMAIVTGATVMCYALYTMSKDTTEKFGTDHLIYTVPFVLFGIFRYLYLVYQRSEGGSPTKILLRDTPLQLGIVLWVTTVILILYVPAFR